MIDLYKRKVERMSDEELADECEYHGKVINMLASSNVFLTREQKVRAITCFEECISRDELSNEHDLLKTALRVLRYL